MDVLIENSFKDRPTDLSRHERFAAQLLEAARENDAELSVAFVDDKTIQHLNHEFRGNDSPTDVLSFPQREGELMGQSHPLGDVVISIETAERQAAEFGHSLDDEISELLFHGFLHLLGNDHDGGDPDDWNRAEMALQNELDKMGVAYRPKGITPYNDSMIRKKSQG